MYAAAMFAASIACLAALLSPGVARAQTWTNTQETPRVLDLLEVDGTGEPSWPFGAEDLADDGSQIFTTAEQGHDLRSAYVDTAAGRLWLRSYVSATDSPPETLTGYLFVDTDASASTGGPAAGDELDVRLADDPSPGGYEYVVVMPLTDSEPTLWQWNEADGAYGELAITPSQAALESGEDTDPLRIGASAHGYFQLEIDLNLIEVAEACGAALFIRSTADDERVGDGDLALGDKSACVAPDENDDQVPDPSVPPECASNDDCPWYGLCVDGECVLARGCEGDAQCAADELCTTDGRCVAAGGDRCESRLDCDDLVCNDGECVACAPDANECGADSICGPEGRCVPASETLGSAGASGQDAGARAGSAGSDGIALEAGEEVSGGAFRCSMNSTRQRQEPGLAALVALGLLGRCRRKRHESALSSNS